MFSEATLLYQCLRCLELPGIDHVQEVKEELISKTFVIEANQKKGIKAQKVNFNYKFNFKLLNDLIFM